MIETIELLGIVAINVGALSALYYKMGRLEGKVDFIYDNIRTVVSFKHGKKN